MYLLLKVIVSAILIAAISELSKRSTTFAHSSRHSRSSPCSP
jgi:hypothetical protein